MSLPISEAPSAALDSTITSEKNAARKMPFSKVQILILLGVVLFVVSHFFHWWELQLVAPQFPGGLYIQATSYEIQDSPKTQFNDIREVNGLNHYIGMMELQKAAQLEMSVAKPAIVVFTIMGLVAAFWKNRWAPLLAAPIAVFPWVYLADLAFWLWWAGHHLDPTAAITLDGFTPHVLGEGKIAQFSTIAWFRFGWYVAAAASIITIVAILMSLLRKPAAE